MEITPCRSKAIGVVISTFAPLPEASMLWLDRSRGNTLQIKGVGERLKGGAPSGCSGFTPGANTCPSTCPCTDRNLSSNVKLSLREASISNVMGLSSPLTPPCCPIGLFCEVPKLMENTVGYFRFCYCSYSLNGESDTHCCTTYASIKASPLWVCLLHSRKQMR